MENNELYKSLLPILRYAVKEPEAVAERLVKRYGRFASLAATEYEELTNIEGVGERGANLIRVAMAIAARRETDKFKLGIVHTEEEIIAYLKALFYTLPNENIYILLLDVAGRVTFCAHLGEGTINTTSVIPRKILELAIKHDSNDVILAHNHPVGYTTPSREDIETTLLVKELLEKSGRRLVSHYIIAVDEYFKIEPYQNA